MVSLIVPKQFMDHIDKAICSTISTESRKAVMTKFLCLNMPFAKLLPILVVKCCSLW